MLHIVINEIQQNGLFDFEFAPIRESSCIADSIEISLEWDQVKNDGNLIIIEPSGKTVSNYLDHVGNFGNMTAEIKSGQSNP